MDTDGSYLKKKDKTRNREEEQEGKKEGERNGERGCLPLAWRGGRVNPSGAGEREQKSSASWLHLFTQSVLSKCSLAASLPAGLDACLPGGRPVTADLVILTLRSAHA